MQNKIEIGVPIAEVMIEVDRKYLWRDILIGAEGVSFPYLLSYFFY